MLKIKGFVDEMRLHKIVYVVLFVIIVVGVFLRAYQYSDLMHFELDQARDVFVIHDAHEEGVDHLPLLGPQARGRELYLGPIFYYFQYSSGLLFGVSPESAALPDLIFSILAIPLFYFFARLFFNRVVSASLTSLVATSLFLVIYGRFAWNPNAMFFWSLVAFYGLLKSWREGVFSAKWFIVAVSGVGIVMQLHFIAFITAPLTFFLYLIVVRARVPWRTVLFSLLVLVILYTPVIVSDVKNDGQNVRAFFASVTMSPESGAAANTAGDAKHDLVEQIFRAGQESGTFYWNILTADNHGRYNIRTKKQEQGYLPLICDNRCKKALLYHSVAIGLFMASLGVFLWRAGALWKRVRDARVSLKSKDQRNGYILIALWLFFGGVFLVMVAYQISPRFYLFLAAPLLILFGFFVDTVYKIRRIGPWIFFGIIFLCVTANLVMTMRYFDVLHTSQSATVEWRDLPMNRDDFVVLKQLRHAGEYIESIDNSKPFIIVGDNRYARALYYLTVVENANTHALCYMKRGGFQPEMIKDAPYYLLVKSGSKKHISGEMNQFHTIVDQQQHGTITMYKMMPKNYSDIPISLPERCFER